MRFCWPSSYSCLISINRVKGYSLTPNNDQCHYSEPPAPRADPGDSGAADSSDQASVAGPGQDLGTSDQGSISTSEAAGAADTEESGDSPDQSDTAVV